MTDRSNQEAVRLSALPLALTAILLATAVPDELPAPATSTVDFGARDFLVNVLFYLVLYQAETDFGRVDLYRGLARALGVEPSYRRAQLWRDIKQRVHELADSKQVLPIWVIDEAQSLPSDFFRDCPAFLNFAFDSHDLVRSVQGLQRGAACAAPSRQRRARRVHAGSGVDVLLPVVRKVVGKAADQRVRHQPAGRDAASDHVGSAGSCTNS